MKHTLRKTLTASLETCSKWAVKKLDLEGTELIEVLRELLSNVMEGSLDPDLAGRTPDIYLNNLQKNRLGDYSKRYITIAIATTADTDTATAPDNDKVIGLLIGLPDPKYDQTMHLYTLGVRPAYRKLGVGSALLVKCINDMYERGMRGIILDVHSANVPSYDLYQKFGFNEILE